MNFFKAQYTYAVCRPRGPQSSSVLKLQGDAVRVGPPGFQSMFPERLMRKRQIAMNQAEQEN